MDMELSGHRIRRLFRAVAAVTLIGGTFGGAASLLAASPASAAGAFDHWSLTGSPGGNTQSAGVAFTLVATAEDITNAPTTGVFSGTINIVDDFPAGDALPTPTAAAACTGNPTVCTIPGVVLGSAPTHHLSLTVGGVPSPGADTGTFTVNPPSSVCSMSSVPGGTPQSATPGAFFPNALQVQLTCGNNVSPAGQHVTFTASNGNVSPAAPITATAGAD